MTVHNTVLTNFIAAREYTNEYQDNSNHNGSHNGLPLFLQQTAAAIALLILSPFLIALAIMIRLESKGSPVFAQIRVGQNGRRFKFYKFRSMYTQDDPRWVDVSKMESDRDGVCKKFKQDPRITPIGRIIRKLSIDELPQLFNVGWVLSQLSGNVKSELPANESRSQWKFTSPDHLRRRSPFEGCHLVGGKSEEGP